MTETKALLIAGCGKLGTRLAAAPQLASWQITGLRRDPSHLPRPIIPWAADLSQPSSLAEPPAAFSHVVYTATPPQYDEATYLATYRDGLAHLLAMLHAQEVPPTRVVLVSSTSVYPQDDGAWVDEESPAAPTHYAGRAIREGEQLLEASGFPYTIIRFGGIYGPTRTQALLGRVRDQRISMTPAPTRYTNRIHEDDCVGCLAHLLTHPNPAPLYVGVDSHPAPRNEVIAWLAAQLGLPTPPTKDQPSSTRRPFSNKRCSNKRLSLSGYSFVYDRYQDGYKAILEANATTATDS